MTHRCIDCKKYFLEQDGKEYGYLCDAEIKQEDAEYKIKKSIDFSQYCNEPFKENDCHKFIKK